jgi:S1-C subfamily serine protease
MKKSILIVFVIYLSTTSIQGQYRYSITSTPDSSEVWINNQLRYYTPCEFNFFWREAKNKVMIIEVKHSGFETWSDSITQKPKNLYFDKKISLKRDIPRFEFNTQTAAVAFDKLLADSFKDGQSIGNITKKDGSQETIKWEGTVKVGATDFKKKFYEIIEKAGFNTSVTTNTKLFAEDENKAPVLPRFIVGLKLIEYNMDMRVGQKSDGAAKNEYVGRTKMSFEWQVLDKRKGEVVITYQNVGAANLRQKSYQRAPNNLIAFEGALIDFLKNSEFYRLVSENTQEFYATSDSIENANKTLYPISKVKTPVFSKKSEMIQFADKACISIITDGGFGSGVIIDPSGLALSAYHVVDGVNRIQVKFSEGLVLDAKIIAFDAKKDVVLLQISGAGFRALPISTEDASIGLDVITIGTPHSIDLGQSVSRGMLSGKRQNESEVVLQADISVSPGNSGGPLLNEEGEIIGIVQSKIVKSGVEGIGFALPITTALEALGIKILD